MARTKSVSTSIVRSEATPVLVTPKSATVAREGITNVADISKWLMAACEDFSTGKISGVELSQMARGGVAAVTALVANYKYFTKLP